MDAKGRIYVAASQSMGHVYQITNGSPPKSILTDSVEIGKLTIDSTGNLWVALIAENIVKIIYNTNQ